MSPRAHALSPLGLVGWTRGSTTHAKGGVPFFNTKGAVCTELHCTNGVGGGGVNYFNSWDANKTLKHWVIQSWENDVFPSLLLRYHIPVVLIHFLLWGIEHAPRVIQVKYGRGNLALPVPAAAVRLLNL